MRITPLHLTALRADIRGRLDGRVIVLGLLYSRGTIVRGLFDPEQELDLPPRRQALGRANPRHGRKALGIRIAALDGIIPEAVGAAF